MDLNFTVFFLGLIILVFGFLKYFGRFAPQRRLQVVVGSYFGCLLVSLAVFAMIPDKGFLELGRVPQSEIEKAKQAARVLNDAALEDRLDQVEGVSIKRKWSFEFNEKTLKVENSTGGPLNVLIVAKGKSINDGRIEIINYTTKNILAGLDFTDKVNAPQVELEGNKLKITEPARYKVDLYRYKDSTSAQFLGKNEVQNVNGLQVVIGHQLLYLSIPEHVTIDDSALGTDIMKVEKAL